MVPERQWKAVMFVSVFLSCVSFAVVMPSLWPYLSTMHAEKPFLARVVAAYSLGEAVGAVAFGAASAASTRAAMVAATALGAAGAAAYVGAPLAPPAAGARAVLLGRALQGAWTGGAQAVQQSHLAKVLPADQLTQVTVLLNAYACLGFVFGPFFGLVASAVPPFAVRVPFAGPGAVLEFNELTAPGYFVLLSAALIIALFVCCFGEDAEHLERVDAGGAEAAPLLATPAATAEDSFDRCAPPSSPSTPPWLALAICNLAFFVHFYGFALQETIATPLVQAYYGWDVFAANLLFTAGGAVSLGAFGALAALGGRTSDRALAAASLVIGAAGFSLLLSTPGRPLSVARFIAGFLTISVAFPVGRAAVIALYTKLLPRAWQGGGQGVILACGAAARIVGPFWAVRAFSLRLGGLVVFGATAGLFLATLAALAAAYPALDAPPDQDAKAGKAARTPVRTGRGAHV
jgi:MFS transporter, ceroid-lipofuscinosis neuronal protein 7